MTEHKEVLPYKMCTIKHRNQFIKINLVEPRY